MDTLVQDSVTLPNGVIVRVSKTTEEWWTTNGGVGYVHPAQLAPDPAQPRKHINPEKLAELHGSIESVGVREPIAVTPRSLAPWVELASEHEDAFFVIVSGHRRWNGACLADLTAVPVRVTVYATQKEHYLDASLLNAGREDLTPIEEGWELVRLREQGWKIDALSKMFGFALPQLYSRMNLTKLHPDIQKMLDPELPPKKRLSTTVGGMLGGVSALASDKLDAVCEMHADVLKDMDTNSADLDDTGRRHLLQRVLLRVIEVRGLNSVRAVEFIRDNTLKFKPQGSAGHHTRRYQPQRRRDVLDNLVKEVMGTVVMDWPPAEFRRIFEYASYEELKEMADKLQGASDFLEGLAKLLSRLLEQKHPTRPEVLELLKKK